jgi:Flp pilus assembly protein TadD
VIEPNVVSSGSADDEERGIALCRAGEWDRGVDVLARLASAGARLSGRGYSFLGYGMAHRRKQVREGLRLCKHAVKLEFYQPDNMLNLARTQLLAGDRRGATASMRRGLAIDHDHAGLVALAKELGTRRRPVLRFLGRRNPLNVLLGRIRHAIKGS